MFVLWQQCTDSDWVVEKENPIYLRKMHHSDLPLIIIDTVVQMKTDSLSARYDGVSQRHSERFSALEQAQVLVARFWETYEELEPWLGETETLITQLPPPAIDTDALRLQQEQMRVGFFLFLFFFYLKKKISLD